MRGEYLVKDSGLHGSSDCAWAHGRTFGRLTTAHGVTTAANASRQRNIPPGEANCRHAETGNVFYDMHCIALHS